MRLFDKLKNDFSGFLRFFDVGPKKDPQEFPSHFTPQDDFPEQQKRDMRPHRSLPISKNLSQPGSPALDSTELQATQREHPTQPVVKPKGEAVSHYSPPVSENSSQLVDPPYDSTEQHSIKRERPAQPIVKPRGETDSHHSLPFSENLQQPTAYFNDLPELQKIQLSKISRQVEEPNRTTEKKPIVADSQSNPSSDDHFAEISYRILGSRYVFSYPDAQSPNSNLAEGPSKNNSWIKWVPLGKSSTIHGVTIPGGGIYIGKSPRQAYEYQQIEPSVIDIRLPVSNRPNDVSGSGLSYWPTYRHISEVSRRTYLEWLARGKKDTTFQIGYIFLYFYGIERRLIHDAQSGKVAKEELFLLQEEVRRLLGLFGENSSFRGSALRLLDYLEVTLSKNKLYELGPKVSDEAKDSIFNQTAIAQLIQDGKDIPAEWALAWAHFGNTCQFRTPVHRAGGNFRRLFLLRYNQHFPKGLKVKINKTKLQNFYRPANQTLEIGNQHFSNLPNPMVLKRPAILLQNLVDECSSLLEPYSRWLGRNAGQELSLRAFSLLPTDLLLACGYPSVNAWRNRLRAWLGEEESIVLKGKSWLEEWPFPDPSKIGKKDSVEFIAFLAKLGVGVEPDPRFGGKPLSNAEKVVLFRINEEVETSGPDFRVAKLEINLSALVAWADGAISAEESQFLYSIIERRIGLTTPEKSRLRANVKWLLEVQPSFSGIKTQLSKLDRSTREAIGHQLVATAISDGRVDAKEIRVLEKLHSLLGLDSSEVISQIHSARSNNKKVSKANRIGTPNSGMNPGFLDPEIIRQRKNESEKVAQMLGDIFDHGDVLEGEAEPPNHSSEVQDKGLFDLDPAHTQLLLWLGEENERERTDVEDFCAKLGLFPDGALETLNEMAFERLDEPLLEDGEKVEIILETYERLFA